MRILIVCKYKERIPRHIAPFVSEQAEALQKLGCEIEYFTIKGRGIAAYFKAIKPLKAIIQNFKPNVIHAHYGLCGLCANFQRNIPVVTTYHGSDINDPKIRLLSKVALKLSTYNIFVSQKTMDIAKPGRHHRLLPCGINLEEFTTINKTEARKTMGLDLSEKYVLFASAFDNHIKDPQLAINTCKLIPRIKLLEMKGYSRREVITLMHACDALLMTSFTEGSPQVVKEAMACGLPIVSTNVGDVSWVTKGISGCYVASSREATEIATFLQKAISFEGRTQGRQRIIDYALTNDMVAKILLSDIYSSVIR